MSQDLLKNKIQASMVAAMRAQDKVRLGVIRLIQAAIKQQEIDSRVDASGVAVTNASSSGLNDDQVLNLLDKMIRQRRDSVKQFKQANRDDLVQKESFEIEVIQEFLPSPLSQAEIQQLIQETIQAVGASSVRDMGKVMGMLKPKIQGRADVGEVGALIQEKLSSST